MKPRKRNFSKMNKIIVFSFLSAIFLAMAIKQLENPQVLEEAKTFGKFVYIGFSTVWNPIVSLVVVIGLLLFVLYLYKEMITQDDEYTSVLIELKKVREDMDIYRKANSELYEAYRSERTEVILLRNEIMRERNLREQ